jgi:hypothetical protein
MSQNLSADSSSALLDVLLAEIDAYRQTRRTLHLAHAARLLGELQTAARRAS